MRDNPIDKPEDTRNWVLLRGLGREAGHWMDFPDRLQEAFPEDIIFCPEFPGNGSRHREKSPLSIQAALADYRKQCLNALGPPPYRVVGLSMGGMVGLAWLQAYADELDFLSVINSSVASYSPPWHRIKPLSLLCLLACLPHAARREAVIQKLTTQAMRDNQGVLQRWLKLAEKNPVRLRNLVRQLIAASRFRPEAPSQVLVSKLQVICSLGDQLVNPRCSQAIAGAWSAALYTHPEAGHDLPLDAPTWLIDQLRIAL